MTLRANYFDLAADAVNILAMQEHYLRGQFEFSETITVNTWGLVKLRISHINQCDFCIDMHSKELRGHGESQQRLAGINTWREMPLYSKHERIALQWAEHITFGDPVDDTYYQSTVQSIGEQAVVDLTIAINAINSWNRVSKIFKPKIGSYKAQ